MRFTAWSLLVWLLVLAIPAQGIAAVRLQHCAPGHSQTPGAAAAVLPPTTGEQHAQGHVHHSAADAATPGEEAGAAGAANGPGGNTDCSACAACCAPGLPADALELPRVPTWAAFSGQPARLRPSFVPGGLDRPPRAGHPVSA